MIAASSMTFADLKRRVALRVMAVMQDTAGKTVADTSQPVDDLLEVAINDAVDEFWRSHDWSFLTRWYEMDLATEGDGPRNIQADPSRYLLPEAIESLPKTKVLFKGPDGQPGGRVEVRHMDEVASMISRDPTGTGSPKYVACEWNTGLAPGPADRGGIELRVFPIPDRAYTLGFRARYSAIPFTLAQQKGQWPQVHDLTIVALAVVEYFRHDRKHDSPSLAVAQAAADAALAKSIDRDNADFRPHTIGAVGEDDWVRGRPVELYDNEFGTTLVSGTAFTR